MPSHQFQTMDYPAMVTAKIFCLIAILRREKYQTVSTLCSELEREVAQVQYLPSKECSGTNTIKPFYTNK